MALPEMRVRISADTGDAVGGLHRVEDAANDTGAAVDRMASRTARAGARMAAQVPRHSNFARSMQNVSFQVGDFATQVGAGTSASIALGQQLPQLLGGFGLLGAAIGAVVAISVPLTRSLVQATEGAKLTSDQFGALEPAIIAIADAAKAVAPVFGSVLSTLADNIDRILITVGGVAAVMAGKWLVGFAAARIATMTLSASLVALRGALIKTGIGAAVVLIGEFAYQMATANSWVRRLLINLGALSGASIAELKLEQSKYNREIEASNEIIAEQRRLMEGATAAEIRHHQAAIAAEEKVNKERKERLADIKVEMKGYEDLARARDAANKPVTILDFSSDKDKGKKEKDAAEELKRKKERLAAGVQAVRESLMNERQLMAMHLEEKRATLAEAFEQDLVTQQERDQIMRDLHDQHNAALAEMDQIKRDEEAAKKGEAFNNIYNLTKGSLGDQLGAWGDFFQGLGNSVASGNDRVLKAMKVFGAAEALVNAFRAFNQVLADPSLPWFAKAAAAAQVLATGLQTVQAIKGVTSGGGGRGGGGRGQSGQAGVAPPQSPLQVRLSGIGPDDLISGSQLGTLLDRLDEEAGDRGLRLLVAA